MKTKPKGGAAVMAQRVTPVDSLEFFPTPPWGTRALLERVLLAIAPKTNFKRFVAHEPAAGEGHMVEILREYFGGIIASDVHDYGKGYDVGSYIGEGEDRYPRVTADWVISNPPYRLALEFVLRALVEADEGVAMFLRSVWAESEGRHAKLFAENPPDFIGVFSDRIALVEGGWVPEASSATSYSWFVWWPRHRLKKVPVHMRTRYLWIPPGSCDALTRPNDASRFQWVKAPEGLPMFGGELETDLKTEEAMQ